MVPHRGVVPADDADFVVVVGVVVVEDDTKDGRDDTKPWQGNGDDTKSHVNTKAAASVVLLKDNIFRVFRIF